MVKVFKTSIFALLLCTIAVLGLVTATADNGYSDIPSDFWAFNYIQNMSDNGILSGYPDGTFRPDNNVSRAEYSKVLAGSAGLNEQNPISYTDVALNHWGYEYISAVAPYLGGKIQNGKEVFLPDENASRVDVAASIVKAVGVSLSDYSQDFSKLKELFSDYESISPEMRAYVSAAVNCGYFGGYNDGTFKPNESVTRAEVCAVLSRSFGNVINDRPNDLNSVISAYANVHFIDVGQGDCEFIELSNGSTILIDAGDRNYGESIVKYIRNSGYNKIDYLIATHPHADHIGGMSYVIENMEIGHVYMPEAYTTTKTYENLLSILLERRLGVTVANVGIMMINEPGYTAEFIAPCGSEYAELNDYSCVLKLTVGSKVFLFMGDAEKISENEILLNGYNVKADVLKVGHHGSKTSSSKKFINAVNPEYAVISCGAGNSYGHPNQDTLNKLESMGVTIFRTDLNGTVVMTTDGAEINVCLDH